ncbi:MAG: HEAT repeat domain-containing protein [Fimbriimonadales bacterium]
MKQRTKQGDQRTPFIKTRVLQSLGRLPAEFDPAPLMRLACHPHSEVRRAAVVALARLANPQLLRFFSERLAEEKATSVRRELVAAIGRLRVAEAIPVLQESLADPDPKNDPWRHLE